MARGAINTSLAIKLYKVLRMLVNDVAALKPQEKCLDEAVRIALESKITVYDALYIAQALNKGEPLTANLIASKPQSLRS